MNSNKYIDRLYKLTDGKTYLGESSKFVKTKSSAPFKKILGFGNKFFKSLKLAIVIRKYSSSNQGSFSDNPLIVCFQNSRTPIQAIDGTIRQQLLEYIKPVLDSKESNFLESSLLEKPIYLLDVGKNEWTKEELEAAFDESIIIFDETILILDSFCKKIANPFSFTHSLIIGLFRLLGELLYKRKFNLVDLAIKFYLDCFLTQFKSSKTVSGVFFTSNSILAESLRFYLLQEDRCYDLCEISHGINSVDVNTYIEDLSDIEKSVSKFKKHRFVEQLPGLPLYGEKSSRLLNGGEYSINVYLNRFLGDFDRSLSKLKIKIKEDLKIAINSPRHEKSLLITFFGYADFQEDLTETKSFTIECFLIDLVLKIASEEGINLKMLYAPHPASDFDRLREQGFFNTRGIKIYKETIGSYFFSDISIALLSATTYESTFFNVKSFTPLIRSDDLHAQKYLDLIYHPNSDGIESLVRSLKELLVASPPISLLERERVIEERIRKIGNLNT